MGRMARKASFLAADRGMVDSDFLALLFMAVKTEGISFFKDELRIF
jgi:hypothetical protein